MCHFELKLHCFEPIIEEPWIINAVNVVVIAEDSEEWLVVQAYDEVSEAEDKELALVKAIDGGEAVALDGMIPGFGP